MPSGAGAWASCRSSRPSSRGIVSVAGRRGAACQLGDLPGLGESGRAQGGFKGSPAPCPASDLRGGRGRRCAGPRVLVGEGPAVLTVAPFLPSHLRTQGLPGKWPPEHPSPPCGRRGLGAPGPSRPEAPRGQGWGPRGADASAAESRVPVLLLAPSERGRPQGPRGGWTDAALLAQPPRGWVGAACSQGPLLRIQIKQFHKPSRGLLRLSKQGPGPETTAPPGGSPWALGRQEARLPELEPDPVVWVRCGQGAGLGRPGRESLAFPGALGQGGGQGPQRAQVCLSSCVQKSWQEQGPLGKLDPEQGGGHLSLVMISGAHTHRRM